MCNWVNVCVDAKCTECESCSEEIVLFICNKQIVWNKILFYCRQTKFVYVYCVFTSTNSVKWLNSGVVNNCTVRVLGI